MKDDEFDQDENQTGIEPVGDVEGPDIQAAIAEAVEAVEAVEAASKHQGVGEGGVDGAPAESVAALEAEIGALRDQSLRTMADFDNYRKRIERERAEERKYATSDLLREVLGIVDNMERALEAGGDLEDLKTGVEMILRGTEDVMRRAGVERVESLEREFDPAVHEAVMRSEDEAVEVPTVTEEMQTGYTLHGRLLRPSIVKVAMPAAGSSSAGSSGGGGAGADEDEG